jgi:hypothetical protein
MFRSFIEERLNDPKDYWAEYEMRTRPWAKKMAGGIVDSSSIHLRTK